MSTSCPPHPSGITCYVEGDHLDHFGEDGEGKTVVWWPNPLPNIAPPSRSKAKPPSTREMLDVVHALESKSLHRHDDPETSVLAADAASWASNAGRRLMLEAYAANDALTDDEAAEWVRQHHPEVYSESLRRRAGDLRELSLIADLGVMRASTVEGASGHPRMVCAITAAGREAQRVGSST